MNVSYSIGEYLRLSSEDGDLKLAGKLESNSIANQRNLIHSFIDRAPEFANAAITEYCDDGWSGKNFDRPDVQRLLEDVKKGRINCIIVKDLSRFGRDYLAVGNYISRVFPFMQVRFIAINDGFDSIRPLDADSLETSFKTLLYDLYSRDLSRKVRSAKLLRAKRGDFLSPFAPYGFVKDPENSKRLVADPEAAAVVRSIYQMAADGMSSVEIARKLNKDGALTRMQYKREAGCSRTVWPCVSEDNFWTHNTVNAILRDERYIGKNVYGKRTRDIVGSTHTVKVKRSEWTVVEETHQGVVTREEFDAAQRNLRPFSEREATFHNRPLDRKVKCGVCGHVMTRSHAKLAGYCCGTPRVTDAYSCETTPISECDITEALLTGLHAQAMIAVEMSELWKEQHRGKKINATALRKGLIALSETLAQQEHMLKDLYEAFASGRIGKDEYFARKSDAVRKRDETKAKIAELEARKDNLGADCGLDNRFVNSFRRYVSVEDITTEIMEDVLDSVIVYPGNRIEIVWNYKKEFEALMLELREGDENGTKESMALRPCRAS